jgi:enoyl-CoA hydratase/carnithine racemase
MEWDTLRFEKEGPIGFLILDRPASLNAVNGQLILDFEEACNAIQADADTRVIILKGEGRAFCSGMDLQAAASRPATPEAMNATWIPWQRALDIFSHLDQLTIASVQGPCLGAGMELVLACDFRIAAKNAFFALPQVLYGSPPDAGPSYRLPQLIGLAKAKELVILGERFDAIQADRLGLLTRLVDPEHLAAETQKLAERCVKVGGKAAAFAKHLLTRTWDLDAETLAREVENARAASVSTGEFSEAMHIYREQRKPQV